MHDAGTATYHSLSTDQIPSHLPWSARLQGPLFHKIAALRRALYLAGKDGKEVEEGVCALVEVSVLACYSDPLSEDSSLPHPLPSDLPLLSLLVRVQALLLKFSPIISQRDTKLRRE